MEIWDAYNRNDTLAGVDLVRGEAIPENLYHGVSNILVMHKDGDILLMQRDFSKEAYPGKYESSAGGSILKGETFLQGAIRELYEETGIKADKLQQINRMVSDNTIYYVYLCVTDVDKSSVILQEGETISYKWVTKAEYLELLETDELVSSDKIRLMEFIRNNFTVRYDCCFQNDTNWFRYRVGAIIMEDDCVLMAGNEKCGYYYSVGGGVHMGETAQDAVLRETYEETGIHFEIDRLAFIHENFFKGDGSIEGLECHEIALYFLMKPKGIKKIDSESYCTEGKETMTFVPIKKFGEVKAFPQFFKDELPNMTKEIKHIITNELI